MARHPTGTITFLFTDIEGSTRLWEQHPQLMAQAFQRQEALLRAIIAKHGGYAYKMIGDAFQAAFQGAADALAASVAAQRALAAEAWGELGPIRVRIALHTGSVEERADDYVGPLLNRVARLMAAAHGGQILLSATTAALVRDTLLAGIELRDLGEHRLRDLIEPERIFQLTAPDLPADFPPLKTLDHRPTNLPVQHTPFIGREKELAQVQALVRRAEGGLVTLTGSGGTGKTRLALQVAADLLEDFRDGVFFVNLAPLTDHTMVMPTIVHTLAVREEGALSHLERLQQYLADKQLLLVLDNFEQVLAAAEQVAGLLAATPSLTVLVTSRAALRLYEEREMLVPSLAVPDPRHLPPLEHLRQYEAVALFIVRAQAVTMDFQLSHANARAVAEICARLDGLPLAIELAAARSKLLTPQAMLVRLGSRLTLLTGGARDLPARHQTLRAAIEWSYDLLEERERTLFNRLAVFAGGATLEAIEAVCNAAGDLPIDPLEAVATLLDKSLLRQQAGPAGEPRIVMLETIREYAWHKLEASREVEAVQQAHATFFLTLAETAEPHLQGQDAIAWLERLDRDYENLRVALEWCGSEGDPEVGRHLAGALSRFWEVRGQWSEGRALLTPLLPPLVDQSCSPPPTVAQAKVLHGAAALAFYQADDVTARSLFERSLAICRQIGDQSGTAWALIYLGWMANDRGHFSEARSLLQESLAICQQVEDRRGIAWSLARLGLVEMFEGNSGAAQGPLEESLALCQELGDRWGAAWALTSLGVVVSQQDDLARGRALEVEAIAIWRELGERRNLTYSLFMLGFFALGQGELAAAREPWREAMTIQLKLGDKWGICGLLYAFAALSAAEAHPERGARLDGAATELREATGAEFPAPVMMALQGLIDTARQVLGEKAWAAAWAEGRAMTLEQAITYALDETRASGTGREP
jgi:predicted ATPase/class 3 adenylate cyclase